MDKRNERRIKVRIETIKEMLKCKSEEKMNRKIKKIRKDIKTIKKQFDKGSKVDSHRWIPITIIPDLDDDLKTKRTLALGMFAFYINQGVRLTLEKANELFDTKYKKIEEVVEKIDLELLKEIGFDISVSIVRRKIRFVFIKPNKERIEKYEDESFV